MKTLLIFSLGLLSMMAAAAAGRPPFPVEAELKTHLPVGMTTQQVVAQLGSPAHEIRERRNALLYRYLAPMSDLNSEKEG